MKSDTIIIILADHGEEFWQHAAFEAKYYQSINLKRGVSHGHTLFQELIRVPFIIISFNSTGEFSDHWNKSTVDE